MRENLDQWPFVVACFAITVMAVLGLLVWSWVAMRRAEKTPQHGAPRMTGPAAMAKAKHQRLVLIVLALIALIAAALLAAWALRSEASYFYLPGQLETDPPQVGQAIRLGGMVQEGSIRTMADGVTVAFIVTDGLATDGDSATVPVRYSGILPDLFVEGSGVVADGRLNAGGVFVADNLLAKHDENYVPRELQELDRHKADETLMRTTQPGAVSDTDPLI